MVALLIQQLGQHVGLSLTLALRLYTGTTLGPLDALAHVQAATAASTDEVSVELLLAVAYVESRFDPRWVSYVERHTRKRCRYRGSTPPKRLAKNTSLYCGPLQTRALTWKACLAQRGLDVSYQRAATELTNWLHDRRVRGDISRALAGYGCGNHGVRTGKCNRYQARVLYQASRFSGGRVSVQARSRS
jgi:hypothetical protein